MVLKLSAVKLQTISQIPKRIKSNKTETLHTLRGEETTHMNSRIIITAGLGVPLSTVPSTINSNFVILAVLVVRCRPCRRCKPF